MYLLCLLGGGYWVIHFQVSLPDYYFSFVLCLSQFILGILAAYYPVKLTSYHSLVFAILFFSGILVGFHQITWQSPLGYSELSLLWLNFIGVLFVVLISSYLFLTVYLPLPICLMVQQFGKLSYSFYLYHFLVILFFVRHREYLSDFNTFNFAGLLLISVLSAVIFQQILVAFRNMYRNIDKLFHY